MLYRGSQFKLSKFKIHFSDFLFQSSGETSFAARSPEPEDRSLLLLASPLGASLSIAHPQVRPSARGFLSRTRALPRRAEQTGDIFFLQIIIHDFFK